MEILSEKRQLLRRSDELTASINYQDHEIREKKDYISSYEGRLIFCSNARLRVLRYELAKMEQVFNDLKEYRNTILLRIKIIEDNQNENT